MSLKSVLTALADAIRSKSGLSGAMTLEQMVEAVNEIQQGGIDTSDATAAATDILAGKTAYVNGQKVTGTHECAAPSLQSKTVTPSESKQTVSPDSGYDGLSSVTVGAVSRTYVGSGVTKKSAATYTPGTADQTIASGQYLSGKQTIKGDANLLPGNIKSGVSIFGVSGSYEGDSGLDTSDATATAEDIADGKTAYVNGEKITGTHKCSGQYAWKKYNWDNGYVVHSESLGRTKPSDLGSQSYTEYSITDDGYFVLSGNGSSGARYYYINDQTTNAESIYKLSTAWSPGNGIETNYYRLTLSYTGNTQVGDFIGFVISDNADEYPDEGSQDGFWYVKITE